MYEFINTERWLSSDLVERIAKLGGNLLVDKERTGIGLSTGASNIPKTIIAPDVIIVPNIRTAKSKRKDYDNRGMFAKGKEAIFFYSGSGQLALEDYSKVDLIVCVADSYLHKKLYEIETRYIFVDEDHTTKIDSGLRENLYWLKERLKDKTNVTYFTATPYQSNNHLPDVVIRNTHSSHLESKSVYVSHCYERSLKELERCYNALKNNERILIASNEARKINDILERLDVNEVRLMSGSKFRKSFFSSLSSKRNVIVNDTASVTIMTTSAFEGHDVNEDNSCVFVFQNHASKVVQFLDEQSVQALGRVRNKPKYLHVNWGEGNVLPYSNTILNFQNDLEAIADVYCNLFNRKQEKSLHNPDEDKESYEGDNFKISYKNHKIKLGAIRRFIVYDDSIFNLENKRIAKVNYIACDVLRSKINIHKNGLNEEFFKRRGYKIISYDDKPHSLNLSKTNNVTKVRNLIHSRKNNPEYISKSELIRWAFDFNTKGDFIKVYKILKKHLKEDMPSHIDYMFKDFTSIQDIQDNCKSIQDHSFKLKLEASPTKSKEPINRKVLDDNVLIIFKCFLKWQVPPKKIRAFRDYNAFAVTSDSVQKHIGSLFNLRMWSPDITSCASTIIQALAGDEKHSVYDVGANRKKSKIKMNMALNFIYRDEKYSEQLLRDVIKPNFLDKSYQLIKGNFYKSGISGLFLSIYTLHEREIIQMAYQNIKDDNGDNLVVRKHDALNVFFKNIDDDDFKRVTYQYEKNLSRINYLGFDDWFGFVPNEELDTLYEVPEEIAVTKSPELYPNTIQYTMSF